MGLRELGLGCEYRSDESNIVQDFYVPCLSASRHYWRAVGYFTSQGLLLAGKGLAEFIGHEGRMRLVASPWLEAQDIQAFAEGYEAREHAAQKAVLRQLEQMLDSRVSDLLRHRLECLACLVAEERLDIKLAVPTPELAAQGMALYHEKTGLFRDGDDDVVAFSGSANETVGGLISNFESFDVFWSWDDPHRRVQRKVENFERLWEDRTPGLDILDFPEAAKQELLRLRPSRRPSVRVEQALEELARQTLVRDPKGGLDVATTHSSLWPHQKEAIEAWESNGRVGLLAMATGSGKTLTALAAAERCSELGLVVIAVPRANLVEQWDAEIRAKSSLPKPMLAYESSASWQERLFTRLRACQGESSGGAVTVVGTMASLSGERFSSVLDDAGLASPSLLIVDEVHNAGAPTYRRILDNRYSWRLGLSATPARHFDEEGTDVIYRYFDRLVYDYDLGRALRDELLCPYRYHVYPAPLSEDEYGKYRALTQRILQHRRSDSDAALTFQSNNVMDQDSQLVRSLLIQRSRILKRCAHKREALRALLDEHELRRALIYCADNEQLGDMHGILLEHEIQHATYTANTPKEKRQHALDAIASGHVPCLLAIDCLDEGVDVPVLDMAIILASSSNKRQFIQRRGRVLRRAVGKKRAMLIDVIAVPPVTVGPEARSLLNGEIARAKEMALLAENRHEAILHLKEFTGQYGVRLTELLSGEGNG